MTTLNLKEAAAFLHMSESALLNKIHKKEIPAAKPAKSWVFIEEDLLAYLRSLYTNNKTQERIKNWDYTNATKHTGTTSQQQMDKEYKALLEQK